MSSDIPKKSFFERNIFKGHYWPYKIFFIMSLLLKLGIKYFDKQTPGLVRAESNL